MNFCSAYVVIVFFYYFHILFIHNQAFYISLPYFIQLDNVDHHKNKIYLKINVSWCKSETWSPCSKF